MCKAQNNFQLLLVKLFSQTYYCSDTKFWPEKCLLCHTSVYPGPPPPSIFFWHFPSSITIMLFTICSILPMFWSSDICLSSFVQLHYSFFSCDRVPTNSVAPFSAYKDTCNPQFLYSLWCRANAPNVSFETGNRGQFMLSTKLITPNYLPIPSQWCSTTVSLETYTCFTYCTKLHQTTQKLHLLHWGTLSLLNTWFYDRINVSFFFLGSVKPCHIFLKVIMDLL